MAGRIIDTLSVLIRMRKTGDGTQEARDELKGLQGDAHDTKDAVGGITAALAAIGGLQFIGGAVAQIESLDQVVGIVNSRLNLQRGEIDSLKAAFLEMERYVPLDALAQLSGELVRAGDTADDVQAKMESAVRLMRIGPELSATGTGRAISYLKALFPDEELRTIEDDIANAIRAGLDLEDLVSEGKFLQFAQDAGTDLGETLMLAAQAQVVGGGGALEDLMRLMSAPEGDHRELLAAVGVDVEQLAGLSSQGEWSRVAELLNQLDTGDLEAVVSSEGVAAIKRFIDLGATLDETLVGSRSNVGMAQAMVGRISDVESLGETKDIMQTVETEMIESMDAGIELLRPALDTVSEWLEKIYGGDNEALEHAVTVAGATGSILVAVGVSNALLRGILTRIGFGGAGGRGGVPQAAGTPTGGGGRLPTSTPGMPGPTGSMPTGRFSPWRALPGAGAVARMAAAGGGLGALGTVAAVGGTTAIGLTAAHFMERRADEVAARLGVSVGDDYERINAAMFGGPEGLAEYDASQSRLSTPGMPGPIGPMTYSRPYMGYESPSLRESGPYPPRRPLSIASTPGMPGSIGPMTYRRPYMGYESPSLRESGPYPPRDPLSISSTPGMWGPIGQMPIPWPPERTHGDAGSGFPAWLSEFEKFDINPVNRTPFAGRSMGRAGYGDPTSLSGFGGYADPVNRRPYANRSMGDAGGGFPQWLNQFGGYQNPVNRRPHADRVHGPGGFGSFDWMDEFSGYSHTPPPQLPEWMNAFSMAGHAGTMAPDLDVYGGYGAASPFDVMQGPGYAPPDIMVETNVTFNIPARDDDAALAEMVVAKTEETINRNFFQAVWDAATGRRK